MGLLMLAAGQGTKIDVSVSGLEADALMAALEDLIARRFGEDR
jgi:phosphocarrier protein